MINRFLLLVNLFFGKLFTLSESDAMKKIVFYCGVNDQTGNAYFRNAPHFLSLEDHERIAVLSKVIAELTNHLEYTVKRVTDATIQEIQTKHPRVAE